ncbi:MAG: UDP-glucose/GDP-mannose dehydrogenase family protein [Candidatus Nanopelagicales bacterium]|nr:UDP-glucose/GDP-mannose dehydrogenase family protein [Candidatus Nanopelagicales bacterium]MCF8541916.1 UDP-glucose/GDP-mannose dehydrogenase family protein [Candidatus Nanopelagicales bacterium]
MPRLSVIGTGYLGATHAACMAELGFEVIGLDVDPAKIALLTQGRVPFYEPGLDEVLQRNIEAGRLHFTTSWEEVADFADVHFICVGTPQAAGAQRADMSQVFGSVEALAPHLKPDALVVGKSTVPVGTAAALADLLATKAAAGVEVAWNPEFLREGFAVQDTLHPDRLVVGVRSQRAEDLLREVYAPVTAEGTPFLVTDFPTAELVKVAANSFLATKISFINAMAEVCEAAGADVTQLAEAIGYDPRIGNRFLAAGLGFGGGCLPKDIRAFMARAGELGADEAVAFLREVDQINLRRRAHTVDLAREALGGAFRNRRITVLGATFKPDSDDVRDSPSLDVAVAISNAGADVVVHDPKGLSNAERVYPHMSYVQDITEAMRGAELVVLGTEWREYRELDPTILDGIVAAKYVIDGRNALDPAQWRSAGWTYRALGRPTA